MLRSSLLLTLLAASTANAQEWPPGAEIDPALHVDITDDGFNQLGGVIDQVLPPSIDIPAINQSGEATVLGIDLARYQFDVWNGKVQLNFPEFNLTPDYDVIHMDATLEISLNRTGDPMYVRAFAEAWTLFWWTVIDQTCEVRLSDGGLGSAGVPIPISADIGLQVVDIDTDGDGVPDTSELDASITNLSINIDALDGRDIDITECGLGDFVEFLEDVGIDLFSLLRPVLQGVLDDQVGALTGDLETTIEDLFNQLVIEQSIDLLGSQLDLKLAPSDVVIVPDGARVSMFGSTSAEENPCIAMYGHEGSLATPGGAEGIGMAAAGVAQPHHVGLFLDDDFGNQALFSVWRAGALCFTVSEGSGLDLPIPINSTLLGLINADVFDPLFPETTPLIIETRPMTPPTMATSSTDDLVIAVEDLGLDFYAGLDGRMVRAVGAALATDVPVNLDFDGNTGELLIDVGLTADDIETTVVFNELAPGRDDEIADSFGGLLGTVIDTVAGGLLSDLAFALPSLDGFGLQSLEFAPSGPGGDWVGGYAGIGTVPYAGGCDENGGCDSGGCSGGCGVTGPSPSRALLFGLPLVIGLRRRRQD